MSCDKWTMDVDNLTKAEKKNKKTGSMTMENDNQIVLN